MKKWMKDLNRLWKKARVGIDSDIWEKYPNDQNEDDSGAMTLLNTIGNIVEENCQAIIIPRVQYMYTDQSIQVDTVAEVGISRVSKYIIWRLSDRVKRPVINVDSIVDSSMLEDRLDSMYYPSQTRIIADLDMYTEAVKAIIILRSSESYKPAIKNTILKEITNTLFCTGRTPAIYMAAANDFMGSLLLSLSRYTFGIPQTSIFWVTSITVMLIKWICNQIAYFSETGKLCRDQRMVLTRIAQYLWQSGYIAQYTNRDMSRQLCTVACIEENTADMMTAYNIAIDELSLLRDICTSGGVPLPASDNMDEAVASTITARYAEAITHMLPPCRTSPPLTKYTNRVISYLPEYSELKNMVDEFNGLAECTAATAISELQENITTNTARTDTQGNITKSWNYAPRLLIDKEISAINKAVSIVMLCGTDILSADQGKYFDTIVTEVVETGLDALDSYDSVGVPRLMYAPEPDSVKLVEYHNIEAVVSDIIHRMGGNGIVIRSVDLDSDKCDIRNIPKAQYIIPGCTLYMQRVFENLPDEVCNFTKILSTANRISLSTGDSVREYLELSIATTRNLVMDILEGTTDYEVLAKLICITIDYIIESALLIMEVQDGNNVQQNADVDVLGRIFKDLINKYLLTTWETEIELLVMRNAIISIERLLWKRLTTSLTNGRYYATTQLISSAILDHSSVFHRGQTEEEVTNTKQTNNDAPSRVDTMKIDTLETALVEKCIDVLLVNHNTGEQLDYKQLFKLDTIEIMHILPQYSKIVVPRLVANGMIIDRERANNTVVLDITGEIQDIIQNIHPSVEVDVVPEDVNLDSVGLFPAMSVDTHGVNDKSVMHVYPRRVLFVSQIHHDILSLDNIPRQVILYASIIAKTTGRLSIENYIKIAASLLSFTIKVIMDSGCRDKKSVSVLSNIAKHYSLYIFDTVYDMTNRRVIHDARKKATKCTIFCDSISKLINAYPNISDELIHDAENAEMQLWEFFKVAGDKNIHSTITAAICAGIPKPAAEERTTITMDVDNDFLKYITKDGNIVERFTEFAVYDEDGDKHMTYPSNIEIVQKLR